MISTAVDIFAICLLGAGLLLATLGLVGLLRMSRIHDQLHALGLITGPAVILVLLASVATGNVEIITSAALVVLFLAVTSPLAGHAIAQAAYREPREEAAEDPQSRPESAT